MKFKREKKTKSPRMFLMGLHPLIYYLYSFIDFLSCLSQVLSSMSRSQKRFNVSKVGFHLTQVQKIYQTLIVAMHPKSDIILYSMWYAETRSVIECVRWLITSSAVKKTTLAVVAVIRRPKLGSFHNDFLITLVKQFKVVCGRLLT